MLVEFAEIQHEIEKGSSATRPSWGDCKIIRGWKESDADFFMVPIPYTKGIIMEICNKKCDCNTSIWIKNQDDVDATDWIIIKPEVKE